MEEKRSEEGRWEKGEGEERGSAESGGSWTVVLGREIDMSWEEFFWDV